jgi:hypothetical protein
MSCCVIADNKITDSSVPHILEILKACPDLEELWLDHNDITIIQKDVIAMTVKDHPHLRAVSVLVRFVIGQQQYFIIYLPCL